MSYSGYDAYTPATPGHVFDVVFDPATRDATWTDISYDLGDQPITDVVLSGATGDVYASTDFGVMRLAKGATAWALAAPEMPKVATYGLTLDDCDGLLYAATHGRGAFSLEVPKGTGPACGATPTPTPTPTPTATPTATPTPTPTPDRTKPNLTLRRVKAVRIPKRSTLKGRATDKSGIARVVVRWGDGRRTTLRSGSGRFTVRHRYRRAKLWRITVSATDKAGNKRTKTVRARVRKKKS